MVSSTGIPKLHVVLAERQLLGKLERAPRASEGIQCRACALDFCSTRIGDLVFDKLVCRSCIDAVVQSSGDELPLDRFIRTISGPVSKGVDAPAIIRIRGVRSRSDKCLTVVASGGCEEVPMFVRGAQCKSSETV